MRSNGILCNKLKEKQRKNLPSTFFNNGINLEIQIFFTSNILFSNQLWQVIKLSTKTSVFPGNINPSALLLLTQHQVPIHFYCASIVFIYTELIKFTIPLILCNIITRHFCQSRNYSTLAFFNRLKIFPFIERTSSFLLY